jgi:hypothetical protein
MSIRRALQPNRWRTAPGYVGIPACAQGRCGESVRFSLSESPAPSSLQTHAIMRAVASKAIPVRSHKREAGALLLRFELIRSALVIDSNCSNSRSRAA